MAAAEDLVQDLYLKLPALEEAGEVWLAVIDQGGYGAQAAAPLVRNIFNYLVTNPIAPAKVPTASTPPR